MITFGRVGVWAPLALWHDPAEAGAELEELGFGAIWVGNGAGMFDVVSSLLDATRTLTMATGVVNIRAHPAAATAARYTELAARHPDRLLLGIGASPGLLVGYLDALDAATPPVPADRRVIGALAERTLAVAARRSAGAHPFLTTPEHTHRAREILGEGPLLAPEQRFVLERDPSKARGIARADLAFYLSKPNYARTVLHLGFDEADLAGGGSDRLVDALVAWGDVDAVVHRIREHRQAGADHVAVQPLAESTGLPREQYRRLAEAL